MERRNNAVADLRRKSMSASRKAYQFLLVTCLRADMHRQEVQLGQGRMCLTNDLTSLINGFALRFFGADGAMFIDDIDIKFD